MLLEDAKKLALAEMAKHPELKGWRFDFDSSVKRLSCCHYDKRMITLSKVLVEANDKARVLNAIWHDITHALTGSNKHDAVWRAKARELGCRDKTCNDNVGKLAPPRYEASCERHGFACYEDQRITFACGNCCKEFNNGEFSAKHLLLYRETDPKVFEASGYRRASLVHTREAPPPRYEAFCDTHGSRGFSNRKREIACKECCDEFGSAEFSDKYLLVYRETDKYRLAFGKKPEPEASSTLEDRREPSGKRGEPMKKSPKKASRPAKAARKLSSDEVTEAATPPKVYDPPHADEWNFEKFKPVKKLRDAVPVDQVARDALKKSIEDTKRVDEPLHVLTDGRLLDGYGRLEIGHKAGVEKFPVLVHPEWADLSDPELVQKSIERNVNTRRNLTEAQWVRIGCKIEETESFLAKQRKTEGQKKGGKDRGRKAKPKTKEELAVLAEKSTRKQRRAEEGRAADAVARRIALSRSTYKRAKKVLELYDADEAPVGELYELGLMRADRAYRVIFKCKPPVTKKEQMQGVAHVKEFKGDVRKQKREVRRYFGKLLSERKLQKDTTKGRKADPLKPVENTLRDLTDACKAFTGVAEDAVRPLLHGDRKKGLQKMVTEAEKLLEALKSRLGTGGA